MDSQLVKDLLNGVTDYAVGIGDETFIDSIEVQEILIEARKTIDELREQVIPMRVLILEIATKYWQITDDAYCPYCGNWYGNIPESNDNVEYDIHESHCVVSAAYHFVKTVPILK